MKYQIQEMHLALDKQEPQPDYGYYLTASGDTLEDLLTEGIISRIDWNTREIVQFELHEVEGELLSRAIELIEAYIMAVARQSVSLAV